ncbi:MAG: GHMP family kinase ATP-binding protein, partial [Promethearchaeota archaeon]
YWSVLYERLKEKINTGFYLEVNSNIPIGRGLSTSAAISVGFLRIMNKAYGLELRNKDIAELAFWGENQELGIQCGRMDQYSITYGGVSFIHTDYNTRVE